MQRRAGIAKHVPAPDPKWSRAIVVGSLLCRECGSLTSMLPKAAFSPHRSHVDRMAASFGDVGSQEATASHQKAAQ